MDSHSILVLLADFYEENIITTPIGRGVDYLPYNYPGNTSWYQVGLTSSIFTMVYGTISEVNLFIGMIPGLHRLGEHMK